MPTTLNAITSAGGGFAVTADSSGELAFQSAGTTYMTLNTSGNVGIGTSSPTFKLQTMGNGGFTSGGPSVSLQVGFASGVADTGLYYDVSGTFDVRSRTSYPLTLSALGSTFTAFNTNGSERMRIDSSGNVGIGTASPTQRLQIAGSQLLSSPGNSVYTYFDSTASWVGRDSASGALVFGANSSERMRIQSGGVINFNGNATPANSGGMTTSYGTTTWTFGGQAGTGTFLVQNPSSVGVFLVNGNTAWSGTSDGRKKDIVGPVENGLNKVLSMNPVRFTWKNDESEVKDIHVGFIAQEMQLIEPDIVETEVDGTLGITYTEIIPILTKAIQELKAELDTVKAELATLKGAV